MERRYCKHHRLAQNFQSYLQSELSTQGQEQQPVSWRSLSLEDSPVEIFAEDDSDGDMGQDSVHCS